MGPTWGPPGSRWAPCFIVIQIWLNSFHWTCMYGNHITTNIWIFPQVLAAQFDGLEQDWSNSSALAMELLQSCTKPSNCHVINKICSDDCTKIFQTKQILWWNWIPEETAVVKLVAGTAPPNYQQGCQQLALWASRCLKSQVTWMFVQQLVVDNYIKTSQLHITSLFWGKCVGDWWITLTKVQ